MRRDIGPNVRYLHSERLRLLEELADDLARCGDYWRREIKRFQDERQKFVVHAAQMGVAGQEESTFQKSSLGQHERIMHFPDGHQFPAANMRSPTGHEVVFAGDWSEDSGDEEILASAHAQERIVITRDKDFGTLAVRDRQPHCGIVRLVELPPNRELAICEDVLLHHEDALRRGALITAEAHRIRIREFQT